MPTAAAKPAKKKSAPKLDAPTLAALHLVTLGEGKRNYKVADAALEALLKKAKVDTVVTLPSKGGLPDGLELPEELRGKKFRVSDKFAKRNSIGVGLSARRFELEEVTNP